MRYEDLIADPLGELETLYEKLDLGDFEQARPAIADNLEDRRGYKRNLNRIDDQDRASVSERWGRYRERFGYAQQPV